MLQNTKFIIVPVQWVKGKDVEEEEKYTELLGINPSRDMEDEESFVAPILLPINQILAINPQGEDEQTEIVMSWGSTYLVECPFDKLIQKISDLLPEGTIKWLTL